MITISLCMIAKNEEITLERCLNCAKDFVDEIIIVDTGSTDKAKEIAKKFTDKIYDFEWIQDFAAARNFSFSKATKEYIFYLDTDDIILEEDQKKLKKLKSSLDKSIDSVIMFCNMNLDKDGIPALSYRRNRLVRCANNFKWYGRVHNYLEVYGNILDSDIAIVHDKVKPRDSDRNLNIHKKMIEDNYDFSPRDVFYYGNELYDHELYEEAIEQYKKLLEMNYGWYEDKINACGKLADYYNYIKDSFNAKKYCYYSFNYDKPRAEFCCRLGHYFLDENNLPNAIFWYELATNLERPKNSWGFFSDDCWTWLPHVQLCVCYYKQGNKELSYKHNETALSYSPNNKTLLNNKEFFKSIGFE
ncbi:tetratricopeptide repeat-containing glycosyltransferase family 2 protein [Clostridium botulinum]|uniref:tetratricopeptide repeat-containing glycosyltransferase family 2 protein n=1 Tax=Clostridium botulinum TaxID=1491 RepID=UPI0005844301|nr:glycosyltransferase family 2 protein [Clostridium botulinum]AJE11477.1 glycosyl transferase 2 family protein [Clostridium botulinum CDC_1436]